MIAGEWFITPHAVKRYQERCDGPSRYEDALARLIEMSETAHRVKEIHEGIYLYRVGRTHGRLRFFVSTREPGKPQLLTVLKGHDHA